MALTALALGLLTAAAWGAGGAALARFGWPELRWFERASLELTAGLGIVSVLLSLALLTHTFASTAWLLAAVALAGRLLAGVWRRRATGSDPRFGSAASTADALAPAWTRAAAWLLLACALAACAGGIAPVTDRDALSYVLPIARHIADEGTLRVWSDQAPSMWPLGHMVLAAFIVQSGGDRLGALSALEWLAAIGAISALARRVCENRDHAPLAVALAIAAPAAAFQVASAKEDLLLAAATAGALFCVSGDRTIEESAAAGLFAGVAAGVKYPGLGVALAIVAWIAVAAPSGRRARAVVAACASCAAVAGVWYALNLWRFGNPVAPFVFGAPGTPLDADAVRSAMDNYGGGRGVMNFFVTPARLFLESSSYCGRAALFHPAVYAGAAALAVAGARRRAAPLLWTAALLYTGWYLTLQNARLLLPAAIALAPPAADRLAALASRSRLARGLIAAGVGVPLLLAPTVGVLRAVRYLQQPGTYLERETVHYSGVAWANAHLDPARHRVLSMFGAVGYFTVPAIGLDALHQLEFDTAALADHRRLLEACRRRGVTHVLARRTDLADVESELRIVYENPASRLGDVHFFRDAPSEATAIFAVDR